MPHMPELFGEFNALLPQIEQPLGEPWTPSLIKGIGNSSVQDGLQAFMNRGMESPRAAQAILRMFAPIEGGQEGKNLWEQIDAAYVRPDLRAKHKDDLVATNYFLLESIASGEQELWIHGKTKPLTKETTRLAKKALERYSQYAASALDREDPRSVKALTIVGKTAKAAPGAAMAALLAACAGQSVIVPPVYETPPAIVSPIGEPMPATATKEPTVVASPTVASPEQLAQQEGINIFDAHTFPEKYLDIARNWLTATDEQWAEYQRFVEAARAKFFEEQGIIEEVAAMTGINENLRSLWGVGYWIQHNRDAAISGQKACLATPRELLTIFSSEPTFVSWQEEKKVTGGKISLSYGLSSLAFFPPFEYNSDIHGALLGRKKVFLERDLSDSANGDLLCVAQPFPDDPTRLIPILHMRPPPESNAPNQHVLYADMAVFDQNYTLPVGSICLTSRPGEQVHAEGLDKDRKINPPGNPDQFFNAVGSSVTISHAIVVGNPSILACADPRTGLEIITEFSTWMPAKDLDQFFSPWPWQQ